MKQILLSGSSNIPLAKKIAKQMNIKFGNITIKKFSDGEKYINVQENLEGKEAIVIQSGSIPSDEHVLELFLILDAVKRLKPKRIAVVLPFYPYRRQERISKKGDAVSAHVIARMLQTFTISKIIVVDLHSSVIKKFYKIPVKEILVSQIFSEYFKKKKIDIVVAPDEGSITRSRNFAFLLKVPLLVMKKTRPKHDEVKNVTLKTVAGKNEEIKNKNIVIIDDEINTAGTLVKNVKLLKKLKAKDIYFAGTHAVFSGPAIKRLRRSGLKEIVVTDSVPLTPEKKFDKIKIISLSKIIANTLS